jgi:hypothetical protein
MDKTEFEAQLKADGYTEFEIKTLGARPANDGHGHPYAVRGLVLASSFTIIADTHSTTYRPGDVFTVEAWRVHAEEIGSGGAQILVGRKY